ncbi:28S ribosomal protein S5, mitochondrial [Phlyctochytrium planicorne]|nr:28S ribosomal protein S5, mitochondrial [Phlyctochytrium planicorne]
MSQAVEQPTQPTQQQAKDVKEKKERRSPQPRKLKSSDDSKRSSEISESSLTKRVLHIRRVARTTSGGKVRSVSAMVVVGNGNGVGGYGEGRAMDQTSAVMKATRTAIKNMMPIERFESRTLFGNITHKFHCVNLTLRAAPPGSGIVANRNIHEICRCLGIRDLSAKIQGSTNPMNVIKATFEALQLQKTPRELARDRGRKVLDIAKTYYGTTKI